MAGHFQTERIARSRMCGCSGNDGVLGDHNRPEVNEYAVARYGGEIRYVYEGQEESTDIGKNEGLADPEESFVSELRYRIFMPGTVLIQQALPNDHCYALFFGTCPFGPKRTRNFTFLARDYDLDDPEAGDERMLEYNESVVNQDRPVVLAQRPEELPLDLTEELHGRGVDRVSIEYRHRWGGFPGRSLAYRRARLQEKSWASPSSSGT